MYINKCMCVCRVRWANRQSNGSVALCPQDCNGRGMCSVPNVFSPSAGFTCACVTGKWVVRYYA